MGWSPLPGPQGSATAFFPRIPWSPPGSINSLCEGSPLPPRPSTASGQGQLRFLGSKSGATGAFPDPRANRGDLLQIASSGKSPGCVLQDASQENGRPGGGGTGARDSPRSFWDGAGLVLIRSTPPVSRTPNCCFTATEGPGALQEGAPAAGPGDKGPKSLRIRNGGRAEPPPPEVNRSAWPTWSTRLSDREFPNRGSPPKRVQAACHGDLPKAVHRSVEGRMLSTAMQLHLATRTLGPPPFAAGSADGTELALRSKGFLGTEGFKGTYADEDDRGDHSAVQAR